LNTQRLVFQEFAIFYFLVFEKCSHSIRLGSQRNVNFRLQKII